MFDITKVLRPFSNHLFVGNLLQDNLVYKNNLVPESTINSQKKKKKRKEKPSISATNILIEKKQLNEEKRNKCKPFQ